jgi:hypothetical protein
VEYRKNISGAQLKWTEDQLLKGLLKYKSEYGRFPSASEIDSYEYLPSSRSIQRSHGGLVALKRKILPDFIDEHDLTRGVIRSNKASEADARAKKYEEEFYLFLCKHFSPMAVHEQKRIRPGDVSSDFFIYHNDIEGTVIDLFYAQDIKTMAKVVNIKLKRYSTLSNKVILFVLVGNPEIVQSDIDKNIANKAIPIPENVKVMCEQYFKTNEIKLIVSKSNYPNYSNY